MIRCTAASESRIWPSRARSRATCVRSDARANSRMLTGISRSNSSRVSLRLAMCTNMVILDRRCNTCWEAGQGWNGTLEARSGLNDHGPRRIVAPRHDRSPGSCRSSRDLPPAAPTEFRRVYSQVSQSVRSVGLPPPQLGQVVVGGPASSSDENGGSDLGDLSFFCAARVLFFPDMRISPVSYLLSPLS